MLQKTAYTFSILGGKTLAYRITKYAFFVGTILGIIGFICMFEFPHRFYILTGSLLIVYLIGGILIPIVFQFFFDTYKVIGKLIMGFDSISIADANGKVEVKYLINEVSNIKINYFESQRNLRSGLYGVYGSNGSKNFLEFEDSNGKKNKYEMEIDNDIKLKQILSHWKRAGIKFEVNYIKPRKKEG